MASRWPSLERLFVRSLPWPVLATLSLLAYAVCSAWPLSIFIGSGRIDTLPQYLAAGVLLVLPTIPLAYLYGAYRNRLGRLEARNVLQAEHLQALYLQDIERHEAERARLARELHDQVLNRLGMLRQAVDERMVSERFATRYDAVVGALRQAIGGLRPAMLDFGLRAGLLALADQLPEQFPACPLVDVTLPDTQARYDASVEQHLFRIVQQASENAVRHAQARRLTICGQLDADRIDLTVEDDGRGFCLDAEPSLSRLVADKHFGLACMFERAALVGAHVEVRSSAGQGTRVRLVWPADGAPTDGCSRSSARARLP